MELLYLFHTRTEHKQIIINEFNTHTLYLFIAIYKTLIVTQVVKKIDRISRFETISTVLTETVL